MRPHPTPPNRISSQPSRHSLSAVLFAISCLLLALLAAPGASRAEDYHLAPGDTLHVMVVGQPVLNLDVPIEMDGKAWFPLVGPIDAGGKTLDTVRQMTAEAYATMSLNRRVVPGGGLPQVIETNQVLVTVASYRPIYVYGNASGTHEIPFRAGMTLHHVIALASAPPLRNSPLPASLDEITAAQTALANEYAQIWRLKSFLGVDTPEDYQRIFVAHLPAIDSIVSVERSILEETRQSIATQKQQLSDEVDRANKGIDVLAAQKKNEDQGLAMDELDLKNVQDLYSKGLTTSSRVSDVRRATLVTASRALQIDVALADAHSHLASLKAQMVAIDSDARIAAWKDLGGAVARAQQRQADLATLAASAGQTLGQLSGIKPNATITRNGVELPAAETLPSLAMMPGDIVELDLMPPDLSLQATATKKETQ